MQHVSPQSFQTAIRFRSPRWKLILRSVAKKHGVSYHDILGRERTQILTAARFEVAYRIRTKLKTSYPWIGARLNRDHSTIVHAVRTHAALLNDRQHKEPGTFRLKAVLIKSQYSKGLRKPAKTGPYQDEYFRRRNAFIRLAHDDLGWPFRRIGSYVGLTASRVRDVYKGRK